MIRSTSSPAAAVLALFGLFLLAGCADSVSPPTADATSLSLMRNAFPPQDVRHVAVCPTPTTASASDVIGPRGGSVTLNGHRLAVRPGVLSRPTRFTITEPAGPHLRIDIEAGDARHYRFDRAVAVTISYARCGRQHRFDRVARAWYLPDTRGRPPQDMMGVVDARDRSITFQTTHLSTYAVAY